MLSQPVLAYRDCGECQKYLYDDKISNTGYMEAGPRVKTRSGADQLRVVGAPPCHCCPKKSPSRAHEFELSPRNRKMLAMYRMVRATGGMCLTDEQRTDALLLRSLTIIDGMVRDFEQSAAANDTARAIIMNTKR